jgi:hypothetical protein
VKLHVLVAMVFVLETQHVWLTATLKADGVLVGTQEFVVFLPASIGPHTVVTVIDAHRCPYAESVH